MELNKNNYEVKMPGERIRPFEQRMLESGLCNFALPMHFVRSGARLTIRYECCGYIALEKMGTLPASLAFEILEKTFLALRSSFDCLLNPDKMKLGLDLVFYHPEERAVRILYLPEDGSEGHSGVSTFLESLRNSLVPEGQPYLDKVIGELSLRNLSLRELANLTGEIRRELYQAGLA